MSLKSEPYYWLECDNCGERADYGEYSAWSDVSQVIDAAVDAEWSIHGDVHHCPACPVLCEKCGKPAGDLAGERDYHCEACWAEFEAEDAAKAATS